MAIRQVLTFPKDEKRLRRVAKPVPEITEEIRTLAEDMLATMYDDGGVGLAATQIDVLYRVVVMDFSSTHTEPMVFINPEIIERKEYAQFEEGCLSVPGCYDKVTRSAYVKFTALDLDGQLQIYEASAPDILCNCIQHEIDHLDGVLFIDHLSPLKKARLIKRLKKMHDLQL